MTTKRFDEDFKKQIVKIYNQGNHTYRSLAEEYGISPPTVGTWVTVFVKLVLANPNNTHVHYDAISVPFSGSDFVRSGFSQTSSGNVQSRVELDQRSGFFALARS